ncbi:MAG: hypothetical protein HFG78_12280, partial [Hungatella sp.]|nr:hypothetical protein [Hungatella sp.]
MIISEAINRAIDYILGNLEEDLSIERVAAHCHFSNVRNNFKEVCDRVVHDSDIAIITRKNDENVVLM